MEVFLEHRASEAKLCGLLHARGGVSGRSNNNTREQQSSPRSWRCFYWQVYFYKTRLVFSTLVEVFLLRKMTTADWRCLLHARGGVSENIMGNCISSMSSPRSWRCFSVNSDSFIGKIVFSTLVEVFPWSNWSNPY